MLRTVVSTAVLLSAGCALVVMSNGCGGSNGPPVTVVIPKGFSGLVWVVVDSSAPDVSLLNGGYQVVIPPNGVLRARSLEPFQRWHTETARFDDGSPLRTVSSSETAAPGEVVMVDLGSGVSGGYTRVAFFVGTMDQYKKWSARFPIFVHESLK